MAGNLFETWQLRQFCGEDFGNWSFRIKSVLKQAQVIKAIEKPDFAGKEENAASEAKAQAIIIAGVGNTHLEYLKPHNSAYDMFKSLENNFKSKGARSRLFLRRLLNETKYDERNPLSQHILRLEDYFSQLKDAESEISEDDKINYLLVSMPRSFDGIVTALETQHDLKWDQVKNSLLGEEEKKKKFQTQKESINCAFLCFNCGRPGHKKFQCRVPQQRGNNSKQSFNQGRGGFGAGRGSSSLPLRGKVFSQRGHGRGNGANFYAEGEDSSDQRIAFLACSQGAHSSEGQKLVWCVDSGCSNHYVNSEVYFNKYERLNVPKKISAAKNGVSLEAIGVGQINANVFVRGEKIPCTVNNVFHVPDVRKNLLSVSKLEENGIKIVFYDKKVRAFLQNKMVFEGNKEGSIYTMDMEVEKSETAYFGTSITNSMDELMLWHKRLGHLNFKSIETLIKKDLVHGLNDLRILNFNNKQCENCFLGKMSRQPYKGIRTKASRPLELIHTDVCGPIDPVTWDGFKYFLTFTDDYTHFVMVYLLKNKYEVYEKFSEYQKLVTNQLNAQILRVRCDNGGEYISSDFKRFCTDRGIKIEYTVPFNPEMNCISERMNRTLLDKARTILIESSLSKEMWGEAIYYSAYVTNRSPTVSCDKTPFELWAGKKPNLCNLRIFGSVAYKHVPKECRRKLEPKSEKLIMVGYAPGGGWRLWNPVNRKIVLGRSVVFDERGSQIGDLMKLSTDLERTPASEELQKPSLENSTDNGGDLLENKENVEEGKPNSEENKRKIKRPVWQKDYEMETVSDDDAMCAFFSQGIDLPSSVEELEFRKDKILWMGAVREELSVLDESETWEVVPRPKCVKPLDTKWVFTLKTLPDDSIVHKARLVVKGFQQKGNFEDIYSPVLKMQTLRILLSVAVFRKYEIHQMDVKGAFLYGRIDEEIFLNPPSGTNIPKDCSLKLKKSLYGLKKSPKYWYERFTEVMEKEGFTRSENDYCLFRKESLFVLLYVDDLLILGNNINEIESLKKFLCSNFRMKDMGNNNLRYLGICIRWEGDNLLIDQNEYLRSILIKYKMHDCKPVGTPLDPKFRIEKDYEVDMTLEHKVRSLIGSLMYATIGTRPDLAASVYYLGRYQSKPCYDVWLGLKHILRYVKGTLNYKLVYKKNNDENVMVGFADADWASSLEDRASTSGYLIKVYGNTVTWRSKKQNVIVISTTEAEYVALCEATIEVCWVMKLLKDLNIECNSCLLLEDNQSTIKSIRNPDQKRLRHIDIKYNFIKSKVTDGTIMIKYINTKEQQADMLTKFVSREVLKYLLNKIGLV